MKREDLVIFSFLYYQNLYQADDSIRKDIDFRHYGR